MQLIMLCNFEGLNLLRIKIRRFCEIVDERVPIIIVFLYFSVEYTLVSLRIT